MRGGTVYLGPESELGALDLAREVRQLSLTLGTASFRIRRMERDEIFEVATPNVSVTFETPGTYRIDVDERETAASPSFRGGPGWRPPAVSFRWSGRADPCPGYRPPRLRRRPDHPDRQLGPLGGDACPTVPLGSFGLVRAPRHLRNRRPRRVRLVGQQRRVRTRLVPERDGRRLGAVPFRALDLARPLGMDVALLRALGLGAVPLRPLGRRSRTLVLGPSRPQGPLSRLLTGRRRVRRAAGRAGPSPSPRAGSSAGSRSDPGSRSNRGGIAPVRG